VPKGTVINYLDELEEAIEAVGYPIVIKPVDGNHGRGITIDIRSWSEADCLDAAKMFPSVIVERYYLGRPSGASGG